MNLVVLTSRSDAPQVPGTPVTSCGSADTGWPCVHPNSLAEFFVTEARDPVCFDSGDPGSCIRFEFGAVAYRADLDASSAAEDCPKALALADDVFDGDATTYSDFTTWADGLWSAVRDCPDPLLYNRDMINVYLMDNPTGNDFSWNVYCPDCTMPVNFIDVDRLPWFDSVWPTEGFLPFVGAASEHEMGHGFGLDHSCAADFPNQEADASNIMQTGPDTCCCESAGTLGYPTTGPWADDICIDCSDDNLAPTQCDDNPDPWDDPDCDDPNFTNGSRGDGFADTVPADWEFTSVGQVDRLLETALEDCEAECIQVETSEKLVRAVTNEIACHGGSGRYQLFPIRRVDRDGDGTGFAELIPFVVSGDHLGRLSELTSISIVDFGDANRLILPTLSQGWHFLPTNPDTLALAGLLLFDATHTSRTPDLGVTRTGYLWGADGVSMSATDWDWPVVDLVWGCNNDYSAPDVEWVSRPANAYRLHLDAIAGSLVQELLIRPDLSAMNVWFELRGNPRGADRIPLGEGQNGTYTWSFSRAGLSMSGWLRPNGQPTGATLEVHFDNASYGSWSRSNFTLPALAKLP